MAWRDPALRDLSLHSNAVDDVALQALVAGLANCPNLEVLRLGANPFVTAAGLASMSTLFQSKTCSLEVLWLNEMSIGDDGAVALADSLVGNTSLKHLVLSPNVAGITEAGWAAFEDLLCDTSSINNTYLSNHTLARIGDYDGLHEHCIPVDIQRYLASNRMFCSKEDVALCKILEYHPILDMTNLFESKLQFLPLVKSWFKRAWIPARQLIQLRDNGHTGDHGHTELSFVDKFKQHKTAFQSRELSAVYQFIRGMPLAMVDQYRNVSRRKRKLDDRQESSLIGYTVTFERDP